ncbi:hypothetical protein OWV82_009290 [Melia azedarach]|uniref:Uncharacterized protein n=1 Tax=Melia azedarach TaxID=155640 RepID=A0ACC1YEN1_MELAZ|nr:hypothetical protein OWV82_009290 [Melia azedarach]
MSSKKKLVGCCFRIIVALDKHHYTDNGDFKLWYEMKVKIEDGHWHFAWHDYVGTFGGINLAIRYFVDSEHVVLGYQLISRLLHYVPHKIGYINEFSVQLYLESHSGQRLDCCKGVRKCGINLFSSQDLEESDEEEE